MKKAVIFFTIYLIIVSIVIGFLIHVEINHKTEDYPLNTIVDKVDDKNDIVICVDYDGNLWTFEGVEDWQEGDFATMIMNDRGTESIYDDWIVTVKYNGNVKGLK